MLRILFLLIHFASAAPLKSMNPVGDHYPILVVEKDVHPQNTMIVYTKLDKNCHVVRDEEKKTKPVFAFYWMMDRAHYKPVHPMLQKEIRKRLKVGDARDDGFDIEMGDFKELKSDLKDPQLKVIASKDKTGKCLVESTLALGPSDQNRVIELDSIYSATKGSIWPPFHTLVSVRLDGHDVKDKSAVHRTYSAN